VKERISAYILEEILGDDAPASLSDDTPLLSSGLLDSLAVEQLLLFLEDELGVAFEESDYSAENFETLDAIDRLVRQKTSAAPA
jgi:acyl carrier protein